MGSSKKHKEKDRDRDKRRDKERDGRKREKDRHRKRDRDERHRDSGSESERKKNRTEDYDDLLEYALQDTKAEQQQESEPPSSSRSVQSGRSDASLSIEETNKLREKLGLKPLQLDRNETTNEGENEKKTSLLDDVHVPAVNISEKERQEKMRKKLEEIREKRRLYKKLEKVKGLGDVESDDDSASAWVKKSRTKDKEKLMAEKRARMQEEMDEEFGIGDLIEEEFGGRKPPPGKRGYSSRNLRGLTVQHDESSFQEGKTTILTLKDSSVLDDEGDTLYNINIEDREKATKNIELKKKRPDYKPYDESEFGADGMFKMKGVLDKYDEEIDGTQKKSFVLESGGSFDTTRVDELQKIQEKLKSEMISLEMDKPRIASEYYTQDEMVQFKKPKKKRKMKKREPLKADDLEAIAGSSMGSADHGSRSLKSILKSDRQEYGGDQPYDVEDMEITPLEQEGDDDYYYNQENENVPLEDDEAQLELEIALQLSRRLKNRKGAAGAEKVAAALSAAAVKHESEVQDTGSIVIDSTSEFCRTLGEIPTYGTSGNREDEEEEEEQEDDVEWKMDVDPGHKEPQGGWEWVKAQEEKQKQEQQQEGDSNVLDDEPIIGIGMAAALQLASKKGLLDSGGKRRVEKFVADLPSVGVIDEEKMRGDDKDRSRSSRYGGGSYGGGSRGEKEGYKPDVKLEYVDEHGRSLTPKEAFRYLSHKFHGKMPAKMKTEKRSKKVEEQMAMQNMSSDDTPLNTAALLKEKQKEAQSPYLILSGGGKTFSTGASLSKSKSR